MQIADRLLRHLELCALCVDQVQRIAVATDLLLIAVAQGRPAEDQCPDTLGVYLHALDAITGNRALDQGMLAQGPQPLWRLAGEQLLTPDGLPQLRQRPSGRHRYAGQPLLE